MRRKMDRNQVLTRRKKRGQKLPQRMKRAPTATVAAAIVVAAIVVAAIAAFERIFAVSLRREKRLTSWAEKPDRSRDKVYPSGRQTAGSLRRWRSRR